MYTPACLPTLNQDFTGQSALLTGYVFDLGNVNMIELFSRWGHTQEGGQVSDVLQELSGLPVVSDSSCNSQLGSVPGYTNSISR